MKSVKNCQKACNSEQIISSDLKPENDASLNITCRKVMITYCITKSHQFKIFDSLVLKLQDTEIVNSSPVLSSVSILQTLKFWVKYVQDVCTVCRRPISNIREGWVGSLRSSSKQQLVAYKLLLRYILLLMHQQSE